MANKQKRPKKFGLAGGKHGSKRKALGYGRKKYQYSCNLKETCVLLIKRKPIHRKNVKKVKSVKQLKKFYQIYRSAETGQLRKRYVKRLFHGKANGYRFINLGSLQEHVTDLSLHAASCKKAINLGSQGISPIELTSEIDNYGLASVLCAKCKGCHREIILKTSPTLNISQKSRHFDINVRAVWGSVATGNGHSHINEFLATTDSPGMNQRTFNKIETEINSWWNTVLQEDLQKAIEEEKAIAIAKGSFHEGIPNVTVICDGGWSKRSHKHSYNALGGVGVIIGAETKKLLHIGIRNKYCCICQKAENVGCKPKDHVCFKNWQSSSQSMEADIIVEGFLNANKHGVRYMTIIADGDSSVFARIKEEVPIWGQSVQKAECANHVCKCLRSNLEKLVDENPSYKGKGNLPKSTRIRIVSSVRCAIRMRSAPNVKNAARLLEKDIKNSVHHVYGNHMNCSSDFCKGKQVLQNNGSQCGIQNETNCDKDIDETSTAENNDYDVISDQIDFWTEGSSIQDQEEARFDSQISCSNSKLLNDIAVILNRVAAKSDRLIGNYTTNLAECWMNIRTKFDGGKMYNHCQRGSWHTRCFAGALRFNEGANWSPQVWEKSTNTVAGEQFQKLYKQRETCLNQNNIYKNCLINKQKRWKRKYKVGRESNTKKARMEYGKEAVDYEPDVTSEELDRKVKEFMDKQINITNAEIEKTEENTKDQSQSEIWKVERKKRLTASNFGSVFKRNPKIKVSPLVKSILYSSFKGTKLTQNGLNKENVTVTEYIEQKKLKNENVKFEKMGLVISKEQPLLAASPDGRITDGKGNSGLIEIKNILYNKPLSLTQAAKMKSVKNFCLEINSNSELLSLKKNHNYYYQCQGLLYVTKCEWIDFVVRTEHPYELHIERIFFNQPLWENHIFPKLKAFYHKALVPEIVVPRYGKIPGIREPGQWFERENQRKKKQRNAEERKNEAVIPSVKPTTPPQVTSAVSPTRPSRNITLLPEENLPTKSSQPKPTNSTTSSELSSNTEPNYSTCCRRSRRQKRIKFVGRRISHLWKDSDTDNKTHWYCGSVLSVKRGNDGDDNALYEVQYDGDDQIYEIDNLAADLRDSQLRFIDI